MFRPLTRWIATVALALPLAANAIVLQFNVSLNAANEVPAPTSFNATAFGIGTLFYDTAFDTFTLSLSAFNLSGNVSDVHIHGQASTTQSAGDLVNLAPYITFNSGGLFSVGAGNAAAPGGLVASGNSHPAQSFLAVLQSGLAYVNIHTLANPGGEIRGQLQAVAIVPELESYAMMLAGLGLLGFIVRRRSRRL